MRFIPSFVLAASVLLAGCGRCDLDAEGRSLAGPGATDCGRVEVGGDRRSVDACVVAAFRAHHAFFARYEEMGIDSEVAQSVVGTSSGAVYLLNYDGDPSGGSGAAPTIDQQSCVGPTVVSMAGAEQLTCASTSANDRVCQRDATSVPGA